MPGEVYKNLSMTKVRTGASQMPRLNQTNFGNIVDLQKFNNAQVYTKGFTLGGNAGVVTKFNLDLGGMARKIHGIVVLVPIANSNDDSFISLNINQELIIDDVNVRAYIPSSNGNPFKPNQYYALPRALSGSDTVILSINSFAANNYFLTFYLSNA